MDSFEAPSKRKDALGYTVSWDPTSARPRFQTVIEPHLDLEAFAAAKLETFAEKLGLI